MAEGSMLRWAIIALVVALIAGVLGFGGIAGAGIGSYMDQQEAELRAQLQGTGVSVTRVGQNIILNMPSNIIFSTDQSNVQPSFNSTLVSVASLNVDSVKATRDVSPRKRYSVRPILTSPTVTGARLMR